MKFFKIMAILLAALPGYIYANTEAEQRAAPAAPMAKEHPLLSEEPRIDLGFSVPVEYTAGIDLGAFYNMRADLYINRYLNFYTNFRLGPNIPGLESFTAGWAMAPVSFFSLGLRYGLEYFPSYRIMDHNAALITSFFLDRKSKPHWFDFEFLFGADFRFTDLDLSTASSKYRRDWLFEWFLLYRFDFLFHPAQWVSTGFAFGNFHEAMFFSSNYFQIEFKLIFNLPKRISLFLKGGMGFSAFFTIAGNINKGWGEAGLTYEIPFK